MIKYSILVLLALLLSSSYLVYQVKSENQDLTGGSPRRNRRRGRRLETHNAFEWNRHNGGDQRRLQSTLVTVLIRFDYSPSDIEWDIVDQSNSLVIASGADYSDNEFANKEFTQVVSLMLGTTYRFTISDAYGDGISVGLYAIFLGTDTTKYSNLLVFSDDFFDTKDSVTFIAQVPITPAPTPLAPTVSPNPTQAPSTCVENGIQGPISNSFHPRPEIKTADDVFPTNVFCTSHTNYQDCTNESREDCQWIFLPSSESKGLCRVDPMSKCLQTGDCVCHTEDFHGGKADYAGGIVFHASISISPRDISMYASELTYQETYSTPLDNSSSRHRHDENFFISKVDFTSRLLTYRFSANSPMYNGISTSHTIAFKLHFLYMDIPLVGTILSGLGMTISVDTSKDSHIFTINGRAYSLPEKLKKWTCTSVLITPTTLYVGSMNIDRVLNEESISVNLHQLVLGSFPGVLFDVRVYSGTLSEIQIREVGARCTSPNDDAALKPSRDIDLLYNKFGCNPMFSSYFEGPTNGGQTYGSGPFATLWVAPREDPFTPGIYYDISEEELDLDYYFQHYKLQTYLYEKYYFEHDLIGFQLEPYRYFQNADQIPDYAASIWNNPCRYMHQSNNLWDFPLYNPGVVPKWAPAVVNGESPNDIFDLRDIFFNKVPGGFQFVAHEIYHEFVGNMYGTYASIGSKWLDESTASFAPASTFPGSNVVFTSIPLAISYPLLSDGFSEFSEMNPHFSSPELSVSDSVRGGHMYNSWLLWWFLAEHANLPFLVGQIFSNERYMAGLNNGALSMIRLYVEANDMDLGDVWGIFVAHYRTWDFPLEKKWVDAEEADFVRSRDTIIDSTPGLTLESRKSTVRIDSSSGTNGQWVAGPSALRPGPFAWNCLTIDSVSSNLVIVIDISWDDGMGFQPNTNPPILPFQHAGCDDDARFYNSMVVAHNPSTGQRRYWKLKGKKPRTLAILTGSTGPVNIHILLVPTPPSDYVGGYHEASATFMHPVPIYSYQYKVTISSSTQSNVVLAPEEPKTNRIVKFSSATEGYWPMRCTCIDDPIDGIFCIDPIFSRKSATTTQSTRFPSAFPTLFPTQRPSLRPTARPPIFRPTRVPTLSPTSGPTPGPTLGPTLIPTSIPSSGPSLRPTLEPTPNPIPSPTQSPTQLMITTNTILPTTFRPTQSPSQLPTREPSPLPTTISPTTPPTKFPSSLPTPLFTPTTQPVFLFPVIPTATITASQPYMFCDDDRDGTFFVESINETQKCVWLAARAEEIVALCIPLHDAYRTCPETCGVCTDDCYDSNMKFDVGGAVRDCDWLRLRPMMQDLLCTESQTAYIACPETCNVCDSNFLPSQLPTLVPVTPSPAAAMTTPSPTRADGICNDERDTSFFVSSIQEFQKCVWLAARPEQQAVLCVNGHESRAYEICPETCKRCVDNCNDSLSKFDVDGDKRNCAWLRLRNNMQDLLCKPNLEPYTLCPETCRTCILKSSETLVQVPTTPPPTTAMFCDDDKLAAFFVPSLGETQQCVWLAARPEQQELLCKESHESGAYHLCPETCGKCSDNCRDTDNKFDYNGPRDCLWLTLRKNIQDEICVPSHNAYLTCPETCDVCDAKQSRL